MKNKILKLSWVPLLLLLFACGKEPNYPKEPSIEFSRISNNYHFKVKNQSFVNTITVALNFKDGDGDLGLAEADTIGKYERIPGNKFYFNYFIEAFIEIDGEFVPASDVMVPGFFLVSNGRYLRLSPDDKNRTLEGELRYSFDILSLDIPFAFKSGDRVKFKVQIADRALNLSNTIETDPVAIFFE